MKIINNFFDDKTLDLIQECYLQNFDKGDWIHGYSFYEKKGVKQNLEIMVLKTDQLQESIVKYLLDAKIIKHSPKDFCVCLYRTWMLNRCIALRDTTATATWHHSVYEY